MLALLFRLCLATLALGPALALDVELTRSGSGVVIATSPATTVTITIRFSEPVTDFTAGDLTSTGEGTLGPITGSGTTYAATWTPPASATGTVRFTVDAAVAMAGTVANTAAIPLDIDFDTQVPALQVTTPAVASITVGSSPVTIDGTTDDAAATIRIREGGPVLATLSGLSWQTDLPLVDGVHALSIVATDPNGNVTTVQRSVTVDTVGPTVTLGAPSPLRVRTGVDAEILVSYADATTGVSVISLDHPDVNLSPGAGVSGGLVSIDGSGLATRTITVSGLSGDGSVVVTVGAHTATDGINNLASAPASSVTIFVDDTAPALTAVDSPDTTAATTFPLVLTFDEALAAAPTLQLDGASLSGSGTSSVGGTVWTFNLSPSGPGEVTLLQVNAVDLAGNPSVDEDDEVLTTVQDGFSSTFAQAVGQSDPAGTSPLRFTVTFGQAISAATFVPADLVLGGTAGGSLTASIGSVSSTVFTVTMTGMTTSGTVTIALPADRVQAAGGINNLASAGGDASIAWQPPVPVVTATGLPAGITPGGRCGAGGLAGLVGLCGLAVLALRRRSNP